MEISKENYLRAMYEFFEKTENKTEIKAIDLSKILNISKSGISQMLKKLKKDKLILFAPYSPIKFTEKGFEKAERITKNYRIIVVFLREKLKLNEKEILFESHKLEHAFSDDVIKKLDLFLDKPKFCFDGKKIPR